MKLLVDDLCFVHRDPGGVYHVAYADCQEAEAGGSARHLVHGLPPEAKRLRVLGMHEHAEFLCRCHRARPEIVLEVGSPLACPASGELQYPRIAINRMRQFVCSPSLGGFHRFTESDFSIYSLVHLSNVDQGPSPRIMKTVVDHPAWYDIGFIPTCDPYATASILASIIDYRWYVDREHPDRLGRLMSALGLSLPEQAKVLRGDASSRRLKLCATIGACWQGDVGIESDMQAPGNFLLRRRDSHKDRVHGTLAASQAFVVYLVRTWQQELARRYAPWQTEPLFVPEQLLRDHDGIDEIEAYAEFAKARPGLPRSSS